MGVRGGGGTKPAGLAGAKGKDIDIYGPALYLADLTNCLVCNPI